MYYRCTKCSNAKESKGQPAKDCDCGGEFVRAERDRRFTDREVYRSDGRFFRLEVNKFVQIPG